MRIKWYGQSCFGITAQNGVRIVMDPYRDMLGYKLPHIIADVVTTSHDHGDHNNVSAIKGKFDHIKTAGTFSTADVDLTGVETFHDKVSGAKKGKNIIYNFKIDGLNVCHCGDLGHLLNQEQINEIGNVDILLLPVGGKFTLNALDAAEVMKQLNPMIIIPMHYRTKALGIPGVIFEKVDKFIKVSKLSVNYMKELEVDMSNIKNKAGIIVLNYRCG